MELVTTILTVILIAVVRAIGVGLNRNDKARSIALTLDSLAKDAVVAAEELGKVTGIDGKEQAREARNILRRGMHQLGFTDVQFEQISNAIKHAWAELKVNGTLDEYKKGE
ncbi:phage holin, LLH family [Limosilactobacillus equigenerosi]|uniref:phage holin, LLH family n=1 Tax=Limosilactobacillus equigenerosi TaxID=417373 RepID=UPI0006D1D3E0|nr:phage holin, LLH family [Limosilactobacillus equigenerosi]